MAIETYSDATLQDAALTATAPRLTLRDGARYLGMTEEGLRSMLKQRRGPAVHKIGRLLRFSLSDLQEFAERNRRPAA